MDNLSRSFSNSLTNSYFLSSTTSTYNGIYDVEIDLDEILLEYQSLLSLSNDFEASCKKNNRRASAIIAGSHLNDNYCKTQNISHVRDEQSFLSIKNTANDFNFSGKLFSMEKLDISIECDIINFKEDPNILSKSGNYLETIAEKITNDYEKIENVSCPNFNSIFDISYENYKSNHYEYKQNSRIIPDIVISKIANNSFVDDNDQFSKENSINLLSVKNTVNSFTSRKKKRFFLSPKQLFEKYNCNENRESKNVSPIDSNYSETDLDKGGKLFKKYFLSPQKLIEKYESEKNRLEENLLSNESSHSKNPGIDLSEEDKFFEIVDQLSNFCLDDIAIEWPSDIINEEEEEEEDESSFDTSTPNEDENSLSQFFDCPLSPMNKEECNVESPLRSNFGISAINFFSRRKGFKYFSTPNK